MGMGYLLIRRRHLLPVRRRFQMRPLRQRTPLAARPSQRRQLQVPVGLHLRCKRQPSRRPPSSRAFGMPIVRTWILLLRVLVLPRVTPMALLRLPCVITRLNSVPGPQWLSVMPLPTSKRHGRRDWERRLHRGPDQLREVLEPEFWERPEDLIRLKRRLETQMVGLPVPDQPG